MDTRDHEERLVDDAATAAGRFGFPFKVAGNTAKRYNATALTVDLDIGGHRVRYVPYVKTGLRPATLGAVIHQLHTGKGRPLLIADHVTPPLADALRTQGVEFIDGAGNMFLNRWPLLAFVKGQRPAGKTTALERGRAFQATGLQVLFALLARPELVARPYREIAVAAGVAHGTVGWVVGELTELGHVATVGGRRRLINGERLMDRWTEGYARTLQPRLVLGQFQGDLRALQRRTAPWPDGLLIGGELAAARLTRHLRPATATLYAPGIDPRLLLLLRLRADARGNVAFRRRFWKFTGELPGITPALLVYADLLAIGDARCLETAQLLRGQLVARFV